MADYDIDDPPYAVDPLPDPAPPPPVPVPPPPPESPPSALAPATDPDRAEPDPGLVELEALRRRERGRRQRPLRRAKAA